MRQTVSVLPGGQAVGRATPWLTAGLAIILGVQGALTGAVCAVAQTGDGVTRYWGVLVGIADYEGTANDLQFCAKDARDLQSTLGLSSNWSADGIKTVLDRAATKAAIRDAVNWIVGAADADDFILFFYSGHGTVTADTPPVDEPDGQDEALVATDMALITDDELGQWLRPALAKKVLVLLDCCFSGGFIKGGNLAPLTARVKTINREGLPAGNGFARDILDALQHVQTADVDDNRAGVVLTASDVSELSYEDATLKHGVFTAYLLEGLTIRLGRAPADANGNNWVTAEEAFKYLWWSVVASTWPQTPQIYDANRNVELDFVSSMDMPPKPARSVAASDTVGDQGGSITVTWGTSRDDGRGANDVVGYTVLRSQSRTGPWVSLATLGSGTTSYVDASTVDGTDYYYMVQARDAQYTSDSEVAGPVRSRDDTPPPPVEPLSAADSPADSGGAITVSWQGYVAPPDFSHYKVYRSTNPFDSVRSAGVVLMTTITDVSVQSYVDQTTQDGTQYWYAVTAVDRTRDTVAPEGNENPRVTAAGPAVSSPNFSFSYLPGASIIAIGADTPEKDLGKLFGLTTGSAVDFARYDPATGQYVKYSATPTHPLIQQAPGRAFWLSTPDAILLNVSGQPVPAGNFAIPIAPGWNMIGNPYTADVDVTNTTVTVGGDTQTLAEASKRNWTRDYMWGYDAFLRSYRLISPVVPFAEKTLRKGRGVFLRSFVTGTITLPRPSDAALPRQGTVTPSEAVPVDWKVSLIAQTEGAADLDNFIGVSSQAQRLNAIASPPAQGVDLYFEGPQGVRSAASFTGHEGVTSARTVKVWSASAGVVTLRWPDLTAMPRNLRPVLTDVATGRRIYMRTVPEYSFVAEAGSVRELTLELQANATGALVVQGLRAAPGSRGATVVFTLNQDAAVDAQVMNAAGRTVRVLSVGRQVAGGEMTTLVWDGQCQSGAPAPAGRYLVRVTARTADGQTASAVRALQLRR